MKDGLILKGSVLIQRRTKDGKIIDSITVDNLIVNSGKQAIAQGTGLWDFDYIGIGEGESGDSVSASDTELKSEVAREQCDSGSPAYESNYKAIYEHTFTFNSGESYEIAEVGLFDASGSGATMFDRIVVSERSVDAENDLYVKITITVSSS